MEPRTELYARAEALASRLDHIMARYDFSASPRQLLWVTALNDVEQALDCPSWAAIALATDAIMRLEAEVKGGAA